MSRGPSLAGGAIVVFGPEALRTLADIRAQGLLEGRLAICSVLAKDLALPDAPMPWAILLFDHATRGPAFWEKLAFAVPPEPAPAVSLAEVAGTGGSLLTLEWLNGVRSSQVKRAALAIEKRWSSPPSTGSSD